MARLPRRWALPITQVAHGGVLLGFWVLFQDRRRLGLGRRSTLAGLILGVLLISQFWTLANLVYDPRQAKRLFGFIGGGAPLGGVAGSALAAYRAKRVGSTNLLLVSAAMLLVCAVIVAYIIRPRTHRGRDRGWRRPSEEKGVGWPRRSTLLRAVEAPADHRARHQLRLDRRGHHRAAAEHGGRGRQGRGDNRRHHARSWPRSRLWTSTIGVRHPGLADQQDPSLPRHRLRADDPAGQPRRSPPSSCC